MAKNGRGLPGLGLSSTASAAIAGRPQNPVDKQLLRQSGDLYRSLFDISQAGTLFFDANGVWIDANPALCESLGFKRCDLEGRAHPELIPPAYSEFVDLIEKSLEQQGGWRGEFPLLGADGREVTFDWHISVDPQSDVRAAVAIDISERKEMELRLRRHAEQQELLFECVARLNRAKSLDDVLDSALSAATSIILADRAAILLADEPGTMRFRAWRGLSRECRDAVEERSPWAPGDEMPAPIVISSVVMSDLDENSKRVFSAEGIGALAFVPLHGKGQLLGALALYMNRPHAFAPADLHVAQAIAFPLASAVERKQAELRLRESEERFRLLADAAPVLIWISNAEKKGVYFNKRWLEFTGRQLAEELGDGWLEHIHPDDLDAVSGICLEAFERRKPFRMEFRMRRVDGEYRWILDHGVPRRDENGAFVGYIGSCIDVTDRKQAELALRQSEQRYRAIVECQSEMVCRFRLDGTILFANGAYARGRRSTPEELVGANFWNFIEEADHPPVREMLRRLSPSNPEVRIENRFITAEGSTWTLWTNRGLLFDESGTAVEVQSSGIDITERKRAEEALREADRRKNEFLAILAHELRNPLAPISSGLELLRSVLECLDGEKRESTEQIRTTMARQVQHLVRLIDDLMDVSRITRRKLELQLETIELAEVVSDAVAATRPLFDEAQHELLTELTEEPIYLYADAVRLTQVISNLLSNAAKYTPHRGIIRLTTAAEANNVVVSVEDSGIGVDSDMIDKIFEMFIQAPNGTPSDSSRGLGVGLTLVKSLVELHGGTVSVANRGRQTGSIFSVRLPVAVPEGRVVAKRKLGDAGVRRPQAAFHRKQRVLIVDDNKAAADLLALVVKSGGREVKIAHDGLEALKSVEEHRPDVVILDLGLPLLDGYEVARRIREMPRAEEIVMIALTGWGQDRDKEKSREAGFNYHLVKPAEPEMIEALLAGSVTLN